MLNSLMSTTKNTIFIFDDITEINFDELLKKPTFLFVSSDFAATMGTKSEQIEMVFILETDKNQVDYRERFDNGEDLIFELADNIYQCYKKEANNYLTSGDTVMAKMKKDQASDIHGILKSAYKSVIPSNEAESSTHTVP